MSEQSGSTAVQEAFCINIDSRRVATALLTGVLAIGTLASCSSSSSAETAPNKTPAVACAELTFSNAAADSTLYGSEAALPKKPAVGSDKEVAPYINGLFDGNGPLAGKGDASSLAIIEAAVTEPAQDNVVFNPKRSIIDAYDNKIRAYAGPNGVHTAASDCLESNNVLTQVATYDDNWATKGGQVVIYKANRGKDNVITGITAENYVVGKRLGGIRLQYNSSTKKFDDFGDVLISTTPGTEGDIFTHGTVTEPQTSKQSLNQQGQKLTPAEKSKVQATAAATAAAEQKNAQGKSGSANTTGTGAKGTSGTGTGTGGNGGGGGGTGTGTGGNGGGGGGEKTTPPVIETTPPVVRTTPPVIETTPPVVRTTPPVIETTPPPLKGTVPPPSTCIPSQWTPCP